MYIFHIFRHFRDYLRLRAAVKMADEQHAKDGDRYYVVPSTNGQLLVMDRKNFKKMKQKGYIDKKVNLNDLRRSAFYYTPYPNGSDAMNEALKKEGAEMYYAWCNFQRVGKKNKKHGKQGKAKA